MSNFADSGLASAQVGCRRWRTPARPCLNESKRHASDSPAAVRVASQLVARDTRVGRRGGAMTTGNVAASLSNP